MSDKSFSKTSNYEVPELNVGDLPFSITAQIIDFVNKTNFVGTSASEDLFLKAAKAVEKINEAIRAINDLRAAHETCLKLPPPDIRPTEGLQG